jgi:small subunit ribosomal protein S13
MPRLSGINIPENKRIEISLTYIHGVGRVLANKILSETKIDPNIHAKDLSTAQIQSLTKALSEYPLEGELKKIVRENIERLKRMGSYRGLRHIMKLPSRGQRTKTNARSSKGRRKTVGSMTKDARQKIEGNK